MGALNIQHETLSFRVSITMPIQYRLGGIKLTATFGHLSIQHQAFSAEAEFPTVAWSGTVLLACCMSYLVTDSAGCTYATLLSCIFIRRHIDLPQSFIAR
jgi:hypothetical protein